MSRHVRIWRWSAALLVLGALIVAAFLWDRGVALASHQFSDVPTGAFYHDFVDFLVRNAITSGCATGLFCPDSAVTRGQAAVFFERLALFGGCSPDMVKSGPTCIDKYEASVWQTQNAAVIGKIQRGRVTAAELSAAGATQLGLAFGDLAAHGCPATGHGCVDVYAVSIAGVAPAVYLTWFQAAAAARNARKRLPTNAEWQVAALGTPDGSPCNTSSGVVHATGTAGCDSDVGAFDMVGNVLEWVADWVPLSTACPGWGAFSNDGMCLAGASTTSGPGALLRGGSFDGGGPNAGPFAVVNFVPSSVLNAVGFRCAR